MLTEQPSVMVGHFAQDKKWTTGGAPEETEEQSRPVSCSYGDRVTLESTHGEGELRMMITSGLVDHKSIPRMVGLSTTVRSTE